MKIWQKKLHRQFEIVRNQFDKGKRQSQIIPRFYLSQPHFIANIAAQDNE